MKTIVSANLTKEAYLIHKKLSKTMPRGWFSKWLSDMLVGKFSKKYRGEVLRSLLLEKQKTRDKLEKEMEKIVKELKVKK